MDNPFHPIMVRRRTDLGLSQREAAKLAGVNRGTWMHWESREGLPKKDRWPVIAETLEVPIEELQQAAAQTWQLQYGPSPLVVQQKTPELLQNLLPRYDYASDLLEKLDADLDLDLTRITIEDWGTNLGQLRSNIRRSLVALDEGYRAIEQQVKSFRNLYIATLLQHSSRPPGKKSKATAELQS